MKRSLIQPVLAGIVAVAILIAGLFMRFSSHFAGGKQTGDNPVAMSSQPSRPETRLEAITNLVMSASSHAGERLAARKANLESAHEIMARSGVILAQLTQGSQKDGTIIARDEVVHGKTGKRDSLKSILDRNCKGMSRQYVNAAKKIYPQTSFKPGRPYALTLDAASGKIKRFEYEIDMERRLVVEGMEQPRARIEEIEYDVVLANLGGLINGSLFKTVQEMGESSELVNRLVDLFGAEINFLKDLQKGDKFSVLIEKRFRNGEPKGYGRILAARFENKRKTYEAFLFRNEFNELHHYNSKGENLKKTMVMAPLAVTRLTSTFSKNRRHPILGGEKPHLGVDYAAPVGTPVKAVGDGSVIKRGWGGGYGNQIILRHSKNLESMYSHLSRYAKGLAEGKRVRQGEIIGYVGNTGLSTGPHLDFRIRQDGKFINPVKAINPRFAPVDAGYLASFHKIREIGRSYLDGKELPRDYKPDSIIPKKLGPKQAVAKTVRNKKAVLDRKPTRRQLRLARLKLRQLGIKR